MCLGFMWFSVCVSVYVYRYEHILVIITRPNWCQTYFQNYPAGTSETLHNELNCFPVFLVIMLGRRVTTGMQMQIRIARINDDLFF